MRRISSAILIAARLAAQCTALAVLATLSVAPSLSAQVSTSATAVLVVPDSVRAPDVVRAFAAQLAPRAPMSDRDFVKQWFDNSAYTFESAESLAKRMESARQSTGGVTVQRVEQRGAQPWLLVQSHRTGHERWIPLYLENNRLQGWDVRLDPFAQSGRPPELPTRRVPSDSIVPVVQQWLGWFAQHDLWSGTVAIAHRDSIVFTQGVGLAVRASTAEPRAAAADTRYHLGSANKMLTAVRILQLVQEGRLRLSDTVQRLLPSYPRADVGSRITVRQLLTHTAGLGGLFELSSFNVRKQYRSHLELLQVLKARDLLFEPGTRYRYANEGYLVLGAIIEQLTGESYEQSISNHILRVADMQGWCDCAARFDVAQRADGYSWREDTDPLAVGSVVDNRWFIGKQGLSLGGYYATAEDMLKFARAMQRGRLLSDSLRTLMWTAEPLAKPAAYGMGMVLNSFEGRSAWGHGGGGGRSGIGVEFGALQDGTWSLAVMGNRDLGDARLVYTPLMRFLARQSLAGV